ncbi:hypothetical protein ACQPVP_08885 [Clostridium nigeriense]|uniref:hypothetical protein n=1 Tax=Clostridium nigeriense TaxID=1805470 RepID=UPI003D32C9AA
MKKYISCVIINFIFTYIGYLIYMRLTDFQYGFAIIWGATTVGLDSKIMEFLGGK